jgi:hypothetical protein
MRDRTTGSHDDYIGTAYHDGGGPSEGIEHIPCHDHEGETIKTAIALDNVGKATLPIRASLHDHADFGGGVDFTDIDVLLRDAGGRAPHGPVTVNEEVGHRGTVRRSGEGFEPRTADEDTLGDAMNRGFIRIAGL